MGFLVRGATDGPALRFGGSSGPRGGVRSTGGTGPNRGLLAWVARLANTQPGLNREDFRRMFSEAGFVDAFDLKHEGLDRKLSQGVAQAFRQYRLLTGGTAPQTAEEVTSPEPEGPGRFQATRPGDLLPDRGAASLRFGA